MGLCIGMVKCRPRAFVITIKLQPRHVSGVGWSAVLSAWLLAAFGILCGLTRSALVLLLYLHVEGHESGGIMAKTRRDAVVSHF